MTRSGTGNTSAWFASGEHRALAWRWGISSGIATLLVWWFQEQAALLVGAVLLYQLFLATRTYAITGRRLFLFFASLPAALSLVLWASSTDLEAAALVAVTALWPLVGLAAVATFVAPGRLGKRTWLVGSAAALLAVAAHTDSVTAFTTWLAPDPRLAEIAGCYRVRRGFSLPLMERPLPDVVHLDTTRWSLADTVATNRTSVYIAGDRRITPSSSGDIGHWRDPHDGSVLIGWTYRRLGGVRGRFRRDGDDLVGRLVQYQDMMHLAPMPVQSVRLERTACPDLESATMARPRDH